MPGNAQQNVQVLKMYVTRDAVNTCTGRNLLKILPTVNPFRKDI